MKITTTAFCSLLLTFGIHSTAWSQGYPPMPALNGYPPSHATSPAYWGPPPMAPTPAVAQGVIQANYCEDGSCNDACTGACGGVCSGGCGGNGESGLFNGLFGRLVNRGRGRAGGGWLDIEYLLLWNKERFVPILATTSEPGTPFASAGVLGEPTTSVLYGGGLIGGDPYSGFRISGGRWVDPERTLGIGSRFWLAGGEEDFSASSDEAGNPILARPFFDTDAGAQDALVVAYPGSSHGSINVTAENRVRGFDVYFRKLLLSGYCNRFDVIGGYHHSSVEDTVDIQNSLISDDDTRIPRGSQIDTQDIFEVDNQFHGGFVGLMAEAEDGRLSWNMLAKVAFGNMNQEATISGSTTSSVPGAGSSTSDFGLLALPSNIGRFDQDEFAIVPELTVSMAYNVSNNFAVQLGYTFIYWSEVALAGDMIDTTINTTQLTGPLVGDSRPSASLTSDGFWYSGLSIGGRLRF